MESAEIKRLFDAMNKAYKLQQDFFSKNEIVLLIKTDKNTGDVISVERTVRKKNV